jgi:ectoine hydroxylase-related dioxygenase (phytanoyl-CoA dioxygenase family)
VASRHYFCNTIWMLDPFTDQNGATRFVPGTHRSGLAPEEVMDDPLDAHPHEVLATGDKGDVIVFDGHVWHGGTGNQTKSLRRGLFSAWVHRDQPQIDDQRAFLLPETYERLTPATRVLLDVH